MIKCRIFQCDYYYKCTKYNIHKIKNQLLVHFINNNTIWPLTLKNLWLDRSFIILKFSWLLQFYFVYNLSLYSSVL